MSWYSSGIPSTSIRTLRARRPNISRSLSRCSTSMTKTMSAHSRSLVETRRRALELVPAERASMIRERRKMLSAVGLRHRFLEQTNSTFKRSVTPAPRGWPAARNGMSLVPCLRGSADQQTCRLNSPGGARSSEARNRHAGRRVWRRHGARTSSRKNRPRKSKRALLASASVVFHWRALPCWKSCHRPWHGHSRVDPRMRSPDRRTT